MVLNWHMILVSQWHWHLPMLVMMGMVGNWGGMMGNRGGMMGYWCWVMGYRGGIMGYWGRMMGHRGGMMGHWGRMISWIMWGMMCLGMMNGINMMC